MPPNAATQRNTVPAAGGYSDMVVLVEAPTENDFAARISSVVEIVASAFIHADVKCSTVKTAPPA